MKRCVSAAALLLVAGSARAQCDFWVPYVPDFDQRRSAIGGTAGLPADGGMYCAPTSVVNWFAYFSNHGLPQPATLAGPRVWQSNSNYDRVTNALSLMGALMGTDPINGTTGGGEYNGALAYSLIHTFPNIVVVNQYWCGSNSICPSPPAIALKRYFGGYTAACYGYYNESPTNFFTRNGGHCITVIGETGVCAGTPYLQFRDPADDAANATQSIFTTRAATMTGVTANFRGKVGQSYTPDTRFRLNYGSGSKFLDGWIVLDPISALTNVNSDPGALNVIHPFHFDDLFLPAVQTFHAPAGTGAILEALMHPQLMDHFYITGPVAPGAAYRLFHLDPLTGQSVEVLSSMNPLMHPTFSRHGELYLCDGSVLKMFGINGSMATFMGSLTLSAVPEALAYEDASDAIAVLHPTGIASRHSLVRYPRALGTALSSNFLQNLPNISGEVSMDFRHSDNHLFVGASGNPMIFHFNNLGNSNFTDITLPAGSSPRAINVSDTGHVMFANNGMLNDYMLPAVGGGWIPDPASLFSGRPCGTRFHLARSRTNHVPALHEGPEFANILNPEIAPGIPDCYANCDGSTIAPILNVNDFSCFLNLYAAGRIEANCDESTTAPVLNVNDFQCFMNRYAAGCP